MFDLKFENVDELIKQPKHGLLICSEHTSETNNIILWCKTCLKKMCQKCVIEHSQQLSKKPHEIMEVSTLK